MVDGWRPRVLVDFDGVIHSYERGWADGTVYGSPIPGAREALEAMTDEGYEVVVFSTREPSQISAALEAWGFPGYRVTLTKEPAIAQIDDRAIHFRDWHSAATELRERYPVR